MTFELFDLPAELVVSVIEELRGDKATLRALARCSRRMQLLAEPLLYESIFLRGVNGTRATSNATRPHERRQRALRRLEVRSQFRAMTRVGLVYLCELLDHCSHLEELIFESPFCNNSRWRGREGWIEDMSVLLSKFHPEPQGHIFQKRLSCLTRVELHLNGNGYEFWTLNADSAVLFAHPTLQDLTLSSLNILDDASALLSGHESSTPLKSLKLDECNLTLIGFATILGTPKALQHLYIGEDRFSDGEHERRVQHSDCNQLCAKDPDKFFTALRQQKHSLQSFQYAPQMLPLLPHPTLSHVNATLTDFTSLTTLKCESALLRTELLLLLVLSDLTAPPNLEHIAMKVPSKNMQWYSLGEASSALPKLRSAELVFQWEDHFVANEDKLIEIGQLLRKHSTDLRVYIATRSAYNPPILYGEELVPDRLAYANYETGLPMYRVPDDEMYTASESTDSEWADTDEDGDADVNYESPGSAVDSEEESDVLSALRSR